MEAVGGDSGGVGGAKRGREETDPLRIINYRTDPGTSFTVKALAPILVSTAPGLVKVYC